MPETAARAALRLRACIFGTFVESPQDTRAADLRRALGKLGCELQDCHVPLAESGSRDRHFRGPAALLRRLLRMLGAWLALARRYRQLPRPDLVLVPYPSHLDVLLARLLIARSDTVLLMDAFLGLHDTVVADRALLAPGSLPARLLRQLEYRSLRAATRVFVDTPGQARMLARDYALPPERFVPVPLGVDESIWTASPARAAGTPFRVVCWCTFIPLHGVPTMVAAARLLQARGLAFELRLIGSGQTAAAIDAELAAHPVAGLVRERAILAPAEIARAARDADCILGIFGESEKAARVIPYKVYQGLASGRPIITADTPAVRDLLVDGENALLVPPGDAGALADAIARLAANPALGPAIGAAGRATFDARLSRQQVDAAVAACLGALFPGAFT